MSKRVLSIGQCGFDESAIVSFFHKIAPEVTVIQAHTIAESLTALNQAEYQLVLVNRIFDRTGEEGLTLLKQVQSQIKDGLRLLLVSNLPDAQSAALALGALPGFGKAQLNQQATAQLVSSYL
jgi:two-component system, chemotaxis family, chemotaxis protein CheY